MKKKPSQSQQHHEISHEQQALSQFNFGHYKEAIALYKKLLSENVTAADNEHYQQQLALCYWLRAFSFAKRGMYKEAVVLWEKQSQHSQPPYKGYDHYISWLIITNNQSNIQACLSQLSTQQLDNEFPELSVLLGLLMITEHREFEQLLAQESTLITHLKSARSALQAYQNDDFDGVKETLKQIPFRSAFRDFRTLLKASTIIPSSSTEAASMLVKIPANSPYSKAASILQTTFQNGSALADELAHFNHEQIKTLCEIKALTEQQFNFIESLSKQNKPLTDKIKFSLAIQYQSLFGSEMAQRFCQALLATYPGGKRNYKKNFTLVDAFEENRYKALACEANNNNYDAEHYWRECITVLSKEENNNALKIALILRHIGEHSAPYEQIECLIESLNYDPEDRECYLKILRYFSQEQDDNYKPWLAKTIAKFPQDIYVLNLATQTAMANKTYKKASQYASKILKTDPVNSFAKQILATNHLAHAHRLIKEKKLHLVENEIQQADKLKLGKSHNDQILLIRGIFCFVNQDKKQGLQQITEALEQINSNPVSSHFQAAMEAILTGLPIATLLIDLPSIKEYLLSKHEFSQFIQKLKQYEKGEENQEHLHKALEKVKTALKKSVKHQDFEEDQMLTFCQILDHIDHYELLCHYSKVAAQKWLKPIWVYYRVYSETNGNAENCTIKQILQLEQFQEQAAQEKSHRAQLLIDNFLNEYYRAHPQRKKNFFDNLFSMSDENEKVDFIEDPMKEIFSHIPEKTLNIINKKIESLSRKTTPEQLAEELLNEIETSEYIILAMMKNPDLFTALMIVKTAFDLNIDINVSVDDVLSAFDVNVQNNSFPFPFLFPF